MRSKIAVRRLANSFNQLIDRKLLLARVAQALGKLDLGGVDIKDARRVLKRVSECVSAGTLDYAYVIAHAN